MTIIHVIGVFLDHVCRLYSNYLNRGVVARITIFSAAIIQDKWSYKFCFRGMLDLKMACRFMLNGF